MGHQYRRVRSGEAPVAVTFDSSNQVALWRPLDEQPRLTWQLPADTKVTEIAVADGDASSLLLAAQSEDASALFDIQSGQMSRAPLECHASKFTVAARSEQASGPIQFATSVEWAEPSETLLWNISGDRAIRQNLPNRPRAGRTA